MTERTTTQEDVEGTAQERGELVALLLREAAAGKRDSSNPSCPMEGDLRGEVQKIIIIIIIWAMHGRNPTDFSRLGK